MAAPVVQLRVPEDMLAAVDGARGAGTRSAWILALIERELLDGDTGRGPRRHLTRRPGRLFPRCHP